ncbi:MAG: hypothetical protein K9M95_10490 [Candidatus Cloacimonetes bacterium]|nr:hypothetical protein [Candidatus Cloacimonadota bacterium]
MNKEEIILKLQTQLGFTAPEAEAYYFMLISDVTAAHLSNLLDINRSYAYGLLKKLISLGFCTEIKGKVRKFRAIEPNLAFASMIEEFEQNIIDLKKLSIEIQPLFQRRKENASDDSVKILHSKAHILDTINKYEQDAKEEIISFSKPPYLMDVSNLQNASAPQRKSILRGVRHMAIYEYKEDIDNFLEMIKFYKNMGEEVRIVEYLPMKLVVFDSMKVVFTLEKKAGKKDDVTFNFFNDESLAKTFRMIFQSYWESSMTYEEFINRNNYFVSKKNKRGEL